MDLKGAEVCRSSRGGRGLKFELKTDDKLISSGRDFSDVFQKL